jgi:hypothetical protein
MTTLINVPAESIAVLLKRLQIRALTIHGINRFSHKRNIVSSKKVEIICRYCNFLGEIGSCVKLFFNSGVNKSLIFCFFSH